MKPRSESVLFIGDRVKEGGRTSNFVDPDILYCTGTVVSIRNEPNWQQIGWDKPMDKYLIHWDHPKKADHEVYAGHVWVVEYTSDITLLEKVIYNRPPYHNWEDN